MPADQNRVRDIFLAAAELSAADRASYLTEECGPDADLRAAVDRLLAAHADLASIVQPGAGIAWPVMAPPSQETETHTPQPDSGSVLVGRYKLLEPIGEGGMGTVWLAQQIEPIKRMVAVKLIKPGMDSQAVLARFEAERQALALMDHPNIARVLDAGATADGHPFFVMELVKGVPITQFCDARKLTPRERLELFVPVCQAIQHAHQKGLIHRDIKPGNVLVALYDDRPVPKVIDFGVAKATGQSLTDHTFNTGLGVVVGTAQYMSPEQATFNNLDVDTRSDIYSLGVLLYELLAGDPPFTKKDLEQAGVLEMLRVVREVEPPRPSTKLSTADALPSLAANRSTEPKQLTGMLRKELDWVVMKALEKDRSRRYDTANGFAADVLRYLSGEAVQAVPPSAGYRVRKFVRKNRWPVAAAAMVLLFLIGAGVAAIQFQRTLARTELVAEKKRLEDLRTADEVARREQESTRRVTRAGSLVQSLASAETAIVPRLLSDLAEYGNLPGPLLREMAKQPVDTKPGLHARMALLPVEPERSGELAGYLLTCRPEELLPVRTLLLPHAATVAPGLWVVLTNADEERGKRVRAACVLSRLAPEGQQWEMVAAAVVEQVTKENSSEAVVWSEALMPVRDRLLPALLSRYPQSRARIESGKLGVSDLAAEVAGFNLTADLLARYTEGRPAELAEAVMVLDARHHRQFTGVIQTCSAAIIPVLRAELRKVAFPGPGAVGGVTAAATGAASVLPRLDPDPVFDALAKRQANAAAVLLTLGEPDAVWSLLRFPKDGDPSARSYLIERLAGIDADPRSLIRRFRDEAEMSAKRALLVALGDFPLSAGWAVERDVFVKELLTLYRDHPDPGLHGAIDWLLRQRWGRVKEVDRIDAQLRSASRGAVAARVVFAPAPIPGLGAVIGVACGALLPAAPVARDRDWYVNGEGQTYAVVRGPVEFILGSPGTEPGRFALNELTHWKHIGRSFAIATKEVTVEQFLEFRPMHEFLKHSSPDLDSPMVSVSWYDATAYCNWLSQREGIPADQWCYEPNKEGKYAEGMRMKPDHLRLRGYRLPTDAEWEYACRSGSVVGRYYGRPEELLPRYEWYFKNSNDRARPVGQLRPNDLGLFDMLGNIMEWVEDPDRSDLVCQSDDIGCKTIRLTDDKMFRLVRGGSYFTPSITLRCAFHDGYRPSNHNSTNGFRVVKTYHD